MFNLGKIILSAAVTLSLSTMAQAKNLEVEVFTSQASGFQVTSTIIEGEKEAILVDAQFTLSAAHKLTAKILESGKTLNTIFITHAHPDHYFGLEVVLQQFPDAKVYASPKVVEQMKVLGPQKFAEWKPIYGSNLTAKPGIATPWDQSFLMLEGKKIDLYDLQPGEIEYSTLLHIPSIETVITGDIAYEGVHPWLAEANAERRAQWIENIEFVQSLHAKKVVAGHKSFKGKDGIESLEFTKKYIETFENALLESRTIEEAKASLLKKWGQLDMEVILDIALKSQFELSGHQH